MAKITLLQAEYRI